MPPLGGIAGAGFEPEAESGIRFALFADIAGAGLDAQRESLKKGPLSGA
jgi:hypothetical protein